jgi:CheY-like chemotaxis protein
MKTMLQLIRKMQLGVGAVFAILGVVGIVSYRSLGASAESERWVQHTHEVLEHLERLLGEITDTSYRGYALSGGEGFLQAARCQELGLAAYLLKPIRQSELREALMRVLAARNQEGAFPLITRFSLQDAHGPAPYLRVLVAEGNAMNQRLMVRLLEKRGHRVTLAANGREALEAVKKEKFDLVLMDVQMPEMGGLEAAVAIRQDEKSSGRHTPIVALTASTTEGDREKCLGSGIDSYVAKPVRPLELEELLESYMARRMEEALAPLGEWRLSR